MNVLRVCFFACVVLFSWTTGHAQPNPYGCHFFRDPPQIGPVSTEQRDGIDDTIARSDTFDIIHYDIHLDVANYYAQTIKGATTITFQPLMADLDHIRFDLFQLQVDSVIGENGPLAFTQDVEYLDIDLPGPPLIGEELNITVYYGGYPYQDPQWGGFYFEQQYIYNLGIGISTIPPNFGKVWYPCFDSFVERATYTYHVKSSGTFKFHGQGEFLGETVLGGDTVIRSYAFMHPIPTHLSAIAVADYQEHSYIHQGASGEIPVKLLAKPTHINTMVGRFVDLGAAIDACEFWYGDYPFDRVGYVHTTDGALEIPTNVAYPQHMNQASLLDNRALLTHELGHHWWGDIVTPYVHNDMWLKEGPAEYSTHLIEEWLGGEEGMEKAVKDNLLYVLKQAHVNDDGFQALSPMPDEHIYGTHTYYKGALVMHNLRGYIGDTLFRHALSTIQEELANTTITPIGFKEALEEYSQIDLDPFFDAWVFAPSYSVFEIVTREAQQMGGQWEIQFEIAQKLRGGDQYHYSVPVDLTMISATGEVHEQQVMLGGETNSLTVNAPFEPAMIVLNRNARLNQARLDNEIIIPPGASFDQMIPWVDMRVYADSTAEDILFRVEHLWVAPDEGPVSPDVIDISTTHYWNVDGLWPDHAPLRARLNYSGQNANQLDHELVDGNEYGMCVLYRPTPTDVWEVYPHQELNSGSLLNGTGNILITELRKGQYAFGKLNGIVSIGNDEEMIEWGLELFPVPARNVLNIRGNGPPEGRLILDLFSIEGRLISRNTTPAQESFEHALEIAALPQGHYILRVITTEGASIGTKKFEVVR